MSNKQMKILLSHILKIEKRLLIERGLLKIRRLQQNTNLQQFRRGVK